MARDLLLIVRGMVLDLVSFIRAQYPVFPAGLKLAIRYSDERGYVTDRVIAPVKYFEARDGREFLRAWCCLRNSERTFRMDRIITARVVVEGKIPENADAGMPRPQPVTTPRSAQTPKKSRHLVLKAACAAVIVLITRGYFKEQETGNYATPPKLRVLLAKYQPETPTVAKAARQKPASEVALDARASEFSHATGIANKELIKRYAAADRDRNNRLSWGEIESFQRALYYGYSYKKNETVLQPDEFFESGGGDCEDWSLVTAGLLRFWGYTSFIGSIRSPDNSQGHAVCLLKTSGKPRRSFYFHFEESGSFNGTQIDAGYYIPIDYDQVGGLTNAVESNWKLKRIYVPESIYGAPM